MIDQKRAVVVRLITSAIINSTIFKEAGSLKAVRAYKDAQQSMDKVSLGAECMSLGAEVMMVLDDM